MTVKTIPIVLLGLVLAFPALAVQGASEGLLLWYQTVLPALAPFLILTQLLTVSGGAGLLVKPVYPLVSRLFHVSASGTYILLCGLLCGYPLGAKLCGDYFRQGKSHKKKPSISRPSAAIPVPCSFLAMSDSSFRLASIPVCFCFLSAFRFPFCPFWHKSCTSLKLADKGLPLPSAWKLHLSVWSPFFYPPQKPWFLSAAV